MDMATRMDGKAVSAKVKEQVAQEVAALQGQGVCPGLAVVIVGEDPASRIYVNTRKRPARPRASTPRSTPCPPPPPRRSCWLWWTTLNHKEDIHGILVQCPPAQGLGRGRRGGGHRAPQKGRGRTFHA